MKSSFAVILILAVAQSVSALHTPHVRIRRQDSNSTDDNAVCNGATVVSTSTFAADAGTIEITKFSCGAATTAMVQADGLGGILGGLLGGLLWWLLPHPHPPQPKPKPTTVTKVSTATATKTATATVTSVTTATATETATSVTTVIQSTTDTATVTVTAAPTSTAVNVCNEICTTVCGQSGRLPPDSDDCAALVNSITILNGQIPPTFDVEPNHVQTISFGTCRFFFENVGPETLEYCWLAFTQTASAAESACFPPVQPVMSEGLCIPSDALWEVGVAHS
ncbi:hypothetical protein ONZ51_g11848 [Trametes cubensis]|uniref:Uncharacterized protein n=1 Tax=Trametes cubensis TaxID=1111947 RepID=A0AAD7X541_9APHY|nr:hypothetical protein ONZ51_g11848 [Trametes cubensis]